MRFDISTEQLDRRLMEIIGQTNQSVNEIEAPAGLGAKRKLPDEGNQKEKRPLAERIVDLVDDRATELFHDQYKDSYAHVQIDDHWETLKIKSKYFKTWLCSLLWEAEGKATSSNALVSALSILDGKAYFHGDRIQLENRVSVHEEAIWYDLADAKWNSVRITANEWEIVPCGPILFRRYSHQMGQDMPARGIGDTTQLLPFFNLANPDQELLLLVYIISCFIPDIPHPIPVFYGPQGAAKTTIARILRSLIDPSAIEVLSMAGTNNELVQQLGHHWFAFYDNVTALQDWASDALCRAVTGDGFSKRELYSDDDDIIYSFRRCVGLNGINLVAKKPDLLDRSLLFALERIPKERRQSEADFWNKFKTVKPIILGGIFDVLVKAMRLRPSITVSEVPRMADFALWGCAISEALGYGKDDFLKKYFRNMEEQHEQAIHENPVAAVIMTFMEERSAWEGTPSALLEELIAVAKDEKVNVCGGGWPKAANALTRSINVVKTNLIEIGLSIEISKGNNGRRKIEIIKVPRNTATIATEQQEAIDIGGGIEIGLPNESPPLNPITDEVNSVCGDNGGPPVDIF